MGVTIQKASDKESLQGLADQIMDWLLENSKHFTARQHILSQMIKNMLVEILELTEKGNLNKARKIMCMIETEIVSLWKENPKKAGQ